MSGPIEPPHSWIKIMQYLSDEFAITSQISLEDIAKLKSEGFATIFCHRPDREGFFQPAFDALKERAESLGLAMHYHPVIPGKISDADLAEFESLYAGAPKPILAFCKSGMRAKVLWEKTRGSAGAESQTCIL